MTAMSVPASICLPRCGFSMETAFASAVGSGALVLPSLALPHSVDCRLCRRVGPAVCPSKLSGAIRPVSAAAAAIKALVDGNKSARLAAEVPLLVHALLSAGEVGAVASLCRRFPLTVAPATAAVAADMAEPPWAGCAKMNQTAALVDFVAAGLCNDPALWAPLAAAEPRFETARLQAACVMHLAWCGKRPCGGGGSPLVRAAARSALSARLPPEVVALIDGFLALPLSSPLTPAACATP